MQYLIKTTTHNTGEVFTDVIKFKSNESCQLVNTESKAEAEEKLKDKKQCPNCESWNTDKEYAYADYTPIIAFFQCYDCGFNDDWKFKEDDQ